MTPKHLAAAIELSAAAEASLDEFLEWIPDLLVQRAIGSFFRALISGLGAYGLVGTLQAVEGGSSLVIQLHKSAIGTVATRSRVPAEWKLLHNIQVWIDDDDDKEGTKLRLKGMQIVPIEGATEAWKIMASLFIEKQAETLDDRRKVAWNWWQGGGRDKFQGTKLWRVVESLAQLGYGQVVPTYAKASILIGCSLGIHQEMTTLHYRNDESSSRGDDVHVVATLQPVAAAYDPTSPEFNRNEDMKDAIGQGLWEEMTSTPFKRATAIRCARSSVNYSALICAKDGPQRGASPASLEKLVTVAHYSGGATKLDGVKGRASPWQYEDETYQMTGDNGRIVWRPLDDTDE